MASKQILSTLVAAFFLTLTWQYAQAGIKCWTNKDGVRECGNVVPPEYAQQSHDELSEQGVTVKQTEAAKSTEELAAEKEAQKLQKERERLAREQAAKDRVLLDTFSTKQDLVLARDGKLHVIDSRIQHTGQIAEKLEANLEQVETVAANYERAGDALPETLLAEIDSLRHQIEEQMLFIEERKKEKEELRAKFEDDLQRYLELKAN